MSVDVVKVWDRPVRWLHWSLVASVATSWWIAESRPAWHEATGYLALAIVLVRIVWGFTAPLASPSSRFARFSSFVRSPRDTAAYAGHLLARRERRYLGHNPLGGWMVLCLMACVLALSFTGWLYTTDRFWGEAWLDRLHAGLAWGLVVAVALHLCGVIFTSLRHRENLVRAMFSGRKRVPSKDDIA